MKEQKNYSKPKGGRPQKAVKRNQLLGAKCTMEERGIIEDRAQSVTQTVSEYLRHMGLTGKIDTPKKVFPKEVLLLTATLNHLAANMNQVAKKRNSFDELTALERAELQYMSGQIKQLAKDLKNYFQ